MLDSTDARVLEEGAEAHAGQVAHQLDQPRGRRGALQARGAAGADVRRRAGGRLHRRGQGPGPGHHARPQARDRRALPRAAHRAVRRRAGGHHLRRARVPGRHRRPELHRLGRGDDRRHPPHQGEPPALQDDPRRLQRLLRPAGRGPRGAELGLSLPLRAGRSRHGDRQLGEARALRRDPGGGARAGRGPHLVARRRSDRRLRRAFPRPQDQADGRGLEAPPARRAPGALHPGRLEGGPVRGPRRGAASPAAARDHQRPAHGGHGRGRPAVQRATS